MVGALAALAGCIPTLAENPPRDARREVPKQFVADGVVDSAQVVAGENLARKAWRELFHSAELQRLIQEALKNNQELNVRLQEIVIAQNEAAARRGEIWPKLSGVVGVGVEKVGGTTSQGVADQANGVPENLGNFRFGFAGTWEVDVWGKLRGAASAAELRAKAAGEGKDFIVTQLVAELARSYFELVALDAQLDVLQRNIALQTDALELVRVEKEAAKVTELAVQRFEAEVAKNKSRRFDLEQARVQAENRINFLVGRYPQPVVRHLEELEEPLPQVLAVGLPAQLLENRPDVRQAEAELAAAKLDVTVARASFFPALSLDAKVGYESFNITHLLATPESLVYGLAGGLVAPLLNRAAIEAAYRSANARQLQAVFTYERTLLQAYTDVVNQLRKYDNLQKGYALEAEQVATLGRSVEVSKVLFQSARADYVEVLMTRRDSLDAQLELIETKKQLLMTVVDLYQALGGGWERPPAKAG